MAKSEGGENGEVPAEKIKEAGGGGTCRRVCRAVSVDVCWQGTSTQGEAGARLQAQDTCSREQSHG